MSGRVVGRAAMGAVGFLGVSAAFLFSSCGSRRDAPFPRAPIVLISLDTVRADAVTGFGGPADATPAIASLLPESVAFTTAVASSHHTAPSHATMLTGFSPFVHGVALAVDDRLFRIPDGVPTLAERLRALGYRTGGFTDGIQLVPQRGFDRGFDRYAFDYSHIPGKIERIEAFLDEAGDDPFFLFVHTYRAHAPYRAADEQTLARLMEDYDGVFAEPALRAAAIDLEKIRSGDEEAVAEQARVTLALSARHWKRKKDLGFLKALYRAGVTAADAELGLLIERLRRRGVLDRAILVVTADHGEAFLEHPPCVNHMDLWDEVLRVPLLFRLPGGRFGGRVVEGQVGHEAIVPTLVELVSGERPDVEGASLTAALLDGAPPPERTVASAMYVAGRPDPVMVSLRSPAGKLFEALVPAQELPPRSRRLAPRAFFDLRRDPRELRDLTSLEPEGMRSLERRLERRREAWAAWRRRLGVEASLVEIDEEAARAMRGIGYLGGK